jgi:hypothetical protein
MLLNIVEIDEIIALVGNMQSKSCYLSNKKGGTHITLGDETC